MNKQVGAWFGSRGIAGLCVGGAACGTRGHLKCSNTWEWDDATWTQRTPADSPPARVDHALARR